jgi:hypothetical protein
LINYAQLLKNIIPIGVLMEMPLPFVHRLRDLRIEQLEAQRKEQENESTPSIDADTLAEALEDGM